MNGLDGIVNVKLLSHPINWLIVWTVMLFVGLAWTLGHEQVTGNNIPSATP